MVKMICCDLDGTLMPYGGEKIDDYTFELIEKLTDAGIVFCPASGRQFPSLEKMFHRVAHRCHFICGNGSVICDSTGKAIAKTTIPQNLVGEITADFLNRSDGIGEVAINGEHCVYAMARGEGSIVSTIKGIKENCTIIKSVDEIQEPVTKISLFVSPDITPYAQRFIGVWNDVSVAIAGQVWLDATCADKGTGVRDLCRVLGIDLADVMAFGDNWNDVAMLDVVGMPFIMKKAAPELLSRYPQRTDHPRRIFRHVLSGDFGELPKPLPRKK